MKNSDKKVNIRAVEAKRFYLGGGGVTHLYMNNKKLNVSSNVIF